MSDTYRTDKARDDHDGKARPKTQIKSKSYRSPSGKVFPHMAESYTLHDIDSNDDFPIE